VLPPGSETGDAIYFFLHTFIHDLQYAKYKKACSLILDSVDKNSRLRNKEVLHALRTVAENSVKSPNKLIADETILALCDVDWRAWLTLLYANVSSEKLWNCVIEDPKRHQELLTLMSSGFVFFHPYVEMTVEKKEEFRVFYLSIRVDAATRQLKNLFSEISQRCGYSDVYWPFKAVFLLKASDIPEFMALIASGADIEQVDSTYVALLLFYCIVNYNEGYLPSLLANNRVNVNSPFERGYTVLHFAIQHAANKECMTIVSRLIARGADVFAEYEKYICPFSTVIKKTTPLELALFEIRQANKVSRSDSLFHIAKMLMNAMLQKEPSTPKPDILKENKILSDFWDNISSKEIVANSAWYALSSAACSLFGSKKTETPPIAAMAVVPVTPRHACSFL